jgi:phosphoglycolate phosphatase
MMAYKNILFDLDGTLTESHYGIVNSVKYALRKFGIEEHDYEKLKQFVGPPLRVSFAEFYGFSEEQTKLAAEYYHENFTVKGIFENKLYDGIDELLKNLKAIGKNIILATSKPTPLAERILAHFHLDQYFTYVVGSNLDGTMLEKDEVIKFALEKNHLKPAESIMVGDRKFDILGAHQNHIDSIAVTYGYGSLEELEIAAPTYFCEAVADILEIVKL